MSRGGDRPDEPSRDDEVDARWRDIVAELGDLSFPDDGPEGSSPTTGRRRTDPPARTVRPAPLSADARDESHDPQDEADDVGESDETDQVVGPVLPASDPRAWAPDPAVDEAEDHFKPPEPEPVLSGDPLLTAAWILAVGMPVLAVVALVFWRDIPSLVLQAAGVAFLGAVGVLLWRMPHERDEDDGPGAVV